jgi:hypothetical protein
LHIAFDRYVDLAIDNVDTVVPFFLSATQSDEENRKKHSRFTFKNYFAFIDMRQIPEEAQSDKDPQKFYLFLKELQFFKYIQEKSEDSKMFEKLTINNADCKVQFTRCSNW